MMCKIAPALILVTLLALLAAAGSAGASNPGSAPPAATPTAGHVASSSELLQARLEWEASAHASTYDQGMGANTTCAHCKSPRNWDALALAAQQALDCGSCKRAPGMSRPELTGGVAIPTKEWQNIGCEICHQPVGDSFSTAVSYWDNSTRTYQPVRDSTELCAHCHEGQHGFQVIEEQTVSAVHQGWACTRCHGPHGAPASCTDCHNPTSGRGAVEHARHPRVDCTACHDAGGLSIALESNPTSRLAARHQGSYMTVRFAHTLTSWPSHNLQVRVDCRRCHHPQGQTRAILADGVACDNAACHPSGAALDWCPIFPRDQAPLVKP